MCRLRGALSLIPSQPPPLKKKKKRGDGKSRKRVRGSRPSMCNEALVSLVVKKRSESDTAEGDDDRAKRQRVAE